MLSISPSLKKKKREKNLREQLPFLKLGNIAIERENITKLVYLLMKTSRGNRT